jgi:hypothetical protein
MTPENLEQWNVYMGPLLANGAVNTFPRQQINTQQSNHRSDVFYAVRAEVMLRETYVTMETEESPLLQAVNKQQLLKT